MVFAQQQNIQLSWFIYIYRIDYWLGVRRKHNMKFRQIAIQLASMDSRFFLKLLVHGTGLLSLKLHHWLYLYQIFFNN